MGDGVTVKRVVAILSRLPEKRFRIMDLAPQLVDEKGKVDIVRAIDRQAEINLAIVEVQSYVKDTKGAVRALQGISGQKLGQPGGYEEEDWDVEGGE